MALLEAHDIGVRRGIRNILEHVTFRATSGDFVAVIGANGAGKSTLLAVLAGLLAVDSGSVTLDGTRIDAFPPRQLARRRAYLPQNPRCEWPISVERLVALGLTPSLPVFGDLPKSFDAAISTALDACDLAERRDQAVTTLSGGEMVRAMLARALVGDPDVLIVDEPLAGLDPKHALDTAARLRTFAAGGKLVIASMHDLTLAGRYASHLFALDQGKSRGSGVIASTLTSELISSVFDVSACVSGSGAEFFVDYRSR